MPYIKKEDRHRAFRSPATPGELNYAITKVLVYYLNQWGRSYITYNEVMGVLECVKQELYRREVVPYEEIKREQNGDVF